MEVQLERFLGPKMLSFEEQDNESIDRSLQRMLGGFRRLLGQIKRLHEQGQFEGNIQAAFEMKSGAFETKLRDLVHQYLQANVRLEKAQIKKSFSSSGKVISRRSDLLLCLRLSLSYEIYRKLYQNIIQIKQSNKERKL